MRFPISGAGFFVCFEKDPTKKAMKYLLTFLMTQFM